MCQSNLEIRHEGLRVEVGISVHSITAYFSCNVVVSIVTFSYIYFVELMFPYCYDVVHLKLLGN